MDHSEFAAGLLVGSFLYHTIVNKDWQRGLGVGIIAAILWMIVAPIFTT